MKTADNNKLKALIVGAGMYVAGRGTTGWGTVIPALNELYREGLIENICVVATSAKSILSLKRKVTELAKMTSTDITVDGFPRKGKDPQAYREAIATNKPDCAIVVVPDHIHFKVASDLINAGVHTLMVKPLTSTVAKAKKLIYLSERKNVYAVVEFHKRYDEANLKLRDIVNDAMIGDILYISVEYSQRRVIPIKAFKNWIKHTNIFQYLGVHYVDIIYFATDAKPLRVLAIGQKGLLKRYKIDNYDSIQAVIEWRDLKGRRFVSTFLTNWIDPNTTSAMSDQKIKVIGTKGRFESDQKHRGVQLVTEKKGIEDINPYFTQPYSLYKNKSKIFKGYGIESIKQFCRDVLSIKCGLNKPSDFEGQRPLFKDALISTAVVEAVNRSLKENSCWVNVTL